MTALKNGIWRLRMWAIKAIARDAEVLLNVKIEDGTVHISTKRRFIVDNCTFIRTPVERQDND